MEWATKSNAFYRSRKIAPATWVLLIDFERERERETERQRDRETETETERQTDRQTDRQRESNGIESLAG